MASWLVLVPFSGIQTFAFAKWFDALRPGPLGPFLVAWISTTVVAVVGLAWVAVRAAGIKQVSAYGWAIALGNGLVFVVAALVVSDCTPGTALREPDGPCLRGDGLVIFLVAEAMFVSLLAQAAAFVIRRTSRRAE